MPGRPGQLTALRNALLASLLALVSILAPAQSGECLRLPTPRAGSAGSHPSLEPLT
jgi:hypothetical protein